MVVTPQCEALGSCSHGMKHGQHERCPLPGEKRGNGRWLCWVHWKASRNPHRTRRLEYVPATLEAAR